MKEFKVTYTCKNGDCSELFDYFIDSYPADEYELEYEGGRLDQMVFYGVDVITLTNWISEQESVETQFQLEIRDLPDDEWKTIKARLDES